jgi:AmmeMemoRadiSam system protein A
MCFTEPGEADKNTLLDVARQSIRHGLQNGTPLKPNPQDYSELLQQTAATFVTLKISERLRGCIGTLEAYQPLVSDVAEHAFAAAFKDPRFSPLGSSEEHQLDIHISMLTPAEPMVFSSQQDLIDQLIPGEDGLILQADHHRGTFLPSVWESLPEPEDFLQHLKLKAGLPGNFWSHDIKVSRYRAVSIP